MEEDFTTMLLLLAGPVVLWGPLQARAGRQLGESEKQETRPAAWRRSLETSLSQPGDRQAS